MSLREIADRLDISCSTARRWTLGINLTPEQLRVFREARITQAVRASAVMASQYRTRRQAWQQAGRARAREGDALHQAGCFLYWAEGSKTRNAVTMANSDLNLLRFFIKFLRSEWDLPPDRFTFRLHMYTGNGLTIRQVEDSWLRTLELPRDCLRAHSINKRPSPTSGVKRNKLPYGVGSLIVTRSTDIIQHIYGAIQKYKHFDEPSWLDL